MKFYLDELRAGWRPLTAAVFGLSCGLSIVGYILGIMGPALLDEFGWSKSEFALIGSLSLGSVFMLPVVGRFTDIFGVRRTALFGVVACPILFLAITQINSIAAFGALYALQTIILVTTTPPVYCRAIVQTFVRARGLALSLAASGPAVTIIVGGPLLNDLVVAHGWRAGYVAISIFAAACGLISLLLLPPDTRNAGVGQSNKKTAKEDYRQILRMPAFWILVVAILLCNLPQVMLTHNLNLVLAENGATGKAASLFISAYAAGMFVGRLMGGFALDCLPPRMVATVGMALSGIGLMLIASGFDSRPVLFFAVLSFGLSLGAESDLIAFLVVRSFGLRIYSSVYGLLSANVAIATVAGSILLSQMVKQDGTYAPFLLLTGILVIVGSLMFLLLPSQDYVEEAPQAS